MNYADGDAWGERQRQFFDDVFLGCCGQAADRHRGVGGSNSKVPVLMHMAFGYLFESFARLLLG